MGKFDPEQLSFDIAPKPEGRDPIPKTREEKLVESSKARRVDLILKAFDLMSAANSKSSFAHQLEEQGQNHKNHKKSHPLSEKYQETDHNAEYDKQQQLDALAAAAYDEACFYCVEPRKECFVDTLPKDPTYRYFHGIEVWFRHAYDRKQFKKELKNNPNAVCSPFPKSGSRQIRKSVL